MSLFSHLAAWVIRRATRRVYKGGHLHHADGSWYMGRWTLFETRFVSARVHWIATPDLDRHLHDHPWSFASLVLTGGYVELRPRSVDPCFVDGRDHEYIVRTVRRAGSFALRRATDRHLIESVDPGTYTLFFTGPKRQWWGFYTPEGKVWWRDYPSCHAAGQAGEPISGGE